MKVAVTGPAGYVGVNLVRLLLRRGDHVLAIDLKEFNRVDAAAVRTALDGVEIVFHLAEVITMARRVVRPHVTAAHVEPPELAGAIARVAPPDEHRESVR